MEVTRDEQGRWVGSDGFVCPATLEEFAVRFPKYALAMAAKSMRNKNNEDIEDTASYIWLNLHRRQTVEKFDPEKMHGANVARFMSYMNQCTTRIIWTKHRESLFDPMTYAVEIVTKVADDSAGVTEEMLLSQRLDGGAIYDPDHVIYLAALREWLEAGEHTQSLNFLNLLYEGYSQTDAGDMLGLKRSTQPMKQLKKLVELFNKRVRVNR